MEDDQKKLHIKLSLLQRLAATGHTPDEIGQALLKRASTKTAIRGIPSALASTKLLGLMALAAPVGLGYGGGYLAERLLGPGQADVEEKRRRRRLRELERSLGRLEELHDEPDQRKQRRAGSVDLALAR